MILYMVINRVANRRYIGITSRGLRQRWLEHLADARSGRGWALHDAIRQYGDDAFEIVEIERSDDWGRLCSCERQAIAKFNCIAPHGYNLTPGGEGGLGRVVSPETRAKISAARKGKPLSDEHRAKLSAAKTGKKMPPRTAEHCAKISDGLKRAWQRRRS